MCEQRKSDGEKELLNGVEIFGEELDLPPEYCRYRDEGCELADSCLNCPFPSCIHDEPGGRQRWLKRLRAREIVRLFAVKGKGVKELAQMFGVSRRTVQRALKLASSDMARREGK